MRLPGFLLAAVTLLAVVGSSAQTPVPQEALWTEFMAWFRDAPAAGNPVAGYLEKVQREGVAKEEVDRRADILMRLLNERQDWVEFYFDKTFKRPLTGNPARDGFSTEPSAFLAEAVKALPAGTALDAGMGQGRNAVYLARQGWNVTGFDISGEAVTAALANAKASGVRLSALKAAYSDFDFGRDRWDLIALVFAWAPVDDPAFVRRVHESLRPGGRVVFEHFVQKAGRPRPAPVHPLLPGQLKTLFRDFAIERYEETDASADWGGPGSPVVRMVAAKNPTAHRRP
jgi:2-polyprenyl-3-methyl-5-hydroxy-6-metoxy-1,4-benzoquinol methylase